ncbi:hypothetical protein QTN25_004306 [Entamoeba marina]
MYNSNYQLHPICDFVPQFHLVTSPVTFSTDGGSLTNLSNHPKSYVLLSSVVSNQKQMQRPSSAHLTHYNLTGNGINRLTDDEKRIRVNEWVSKTPKSCEYPHPLNYND